MDEERTLSFEETVSNYDAKFRERMAQEEAKAEADRDEYLIEYLNAMLYTTETILKYPTEKFKNADESFKENLCRMAFKDFLYEENKKETRQQA